jgi:hypothetical protein
MTTHVFAGPTIPGPDIHAIVPDAVIHPPVRHGDLVALAPAPEDTIAIIDGLFFRTAAIRHKEIMHLLQQGVPVWGGSSMGALRAAELDVFGMRGVGSVYGMYSSGVVTGDDEVAVLHGPAEAGYRPLNEAMVSIRVAGSRARGHGVLDAGEEDLLINAAKALPFGERSYPAVIEAAVGRGLPRAKARAFREYLSAHPCNLKREDAEALLRLVAAGEQDWPGPPAARPGQRMPMTSFLLRWIRSAPTSWIDGQPVSVMDTLTACQLFADDYPALHYRVLLADLVTREVGETRLPGTEAGLAEWEELACTAAATRGLIPAASVTVPPAFAAWLTADELNGPVRPAIARALVRSYRWEPSVRPIDPLVDLLSGTPAWQQAQAEVARAGKLNAELAAMKDTFSPHYIPDGRLHEWLRTRWQTTDLRTTMLDRGFSSFADLRARATPFMPLDAAHGVERFTLLSAATACPVTPSG